MRVTAEGEDVSVLGVCGSWYRVSVGGDAGYIRSDYVALDSAGGERPVRRFNLAATLASAFVVVTAILCMALL